MKNNTSFFSSNNVYYSPAPKLQPMYIYRLLKYPKENPIFISADQHSLCFIRRLGGTCLFCPKSISNYDFSFSFQREIWVLYSRRIDAPKAMQLAQAIQQSGANKILALLINTKFV